MKDLFSLSSYDYHLPQELVAQVPSAKRDFSRLMIVDRKTGHISEIVFHELKDFLESGDTLIFNNTKVFPARLFGKRGGGGIAEVLLVKQEEEKVWQAMVRPGKKLPEGASIFFGEGFSCRVLDILPEGLRRIQFQCEGLIAPYLETYGHLPLPQYIRKGEESSIDRERYQTVYATTPGAVAAPTAGLHFTPELLSELKEKGLNQIYITLHVGLGTFKPVKVEDIRSHSMHKEEISISKEAALALNNPSSHKRKICVGTTCCRALESSVNPSGLIEPGFKDTSIFIYPGYEFKAAKQLLTNFHLPKSTLLMLVASFAGYDLTMEAYAKAIEKRFRFFSYGDAMLIL